MVVGVAVAAVGNQQQQRLRAGEIYVEVVGRVVSAQHRRFRLPHTVHPYAEAGGAPTLGGVVYAGHRQEPRRSPLEIHHERAGGRRADAVFKDFPAQRNLETAYGFSGAGFLDVLPNRTQVQCIQPQAVRGRLSPCQRFPGDCRVRQAEQAQDKQNSYVQETAAHKISAHGWLPFLIYDDVFMFRWTPLKRIPKIFPR
ncbi:MAG: hypothetical protein BWX80_03595 [Candidatus Hydrogenedentes bacterium ADurb.Bin101]|nr:MAG: hypothetical protein BWX80_03595 [Candidatus Hydrogenedentes bacterium ADurb.Bin101]